MIRYGTFTSSAGVELPFKIELDDLPVSSLRGLAKVIRVELERRGEGYGPVTLPAATTCQSLYVLALYVGEGSAPGGVPVLLDDVWTTGRTMISLRQRVARQSLVQPRGIVVFARSHTPEWVLPIFKTFECNDRR